MGENIMNKFYEQKILELLEEAIKLLTLAVQMLK